MRELNRIEFLKNYKGAKVKFLKDGDNDYVENLQMIIYLEGIDDVVYATKLNAFEICPVTYYELTRRYPKIPFIFNSEKVEGKKIKMKEADHKKLKDFLAKFRYKPANMIYNEVLATMGKLEGEKFSQKEKKINRSNVTIVDI